MVDLPVWLVLDDNLLKSLKHLTWRFQGSQETFREHHKFEQYDIERVSFSQTNW